MSSDGTFGYLSDERSVELVELLRKQCEVFEGIDRAGQSDALAAAALLINERVRTLAAALLGCVDRMELLLDDQKREVVEAARARIGSPAGDQVVMLRDGVRDGDAQWV